MSANFPRGAWAMARARTSTTWTLTGAWSFSHLGFQPRAWASVTTSSWTPSKHALQDPHPGEQVPPGKPCRPVGPAQHVQDHRYRGDVAPSPSGDLPARGEGLRDHSTGGRCYLARVAGGRCGHRLA